MALIATIVDAATGATVQKMKFPPATSAQISFASKDGLRFAIQCKDLTKPVGVSAVQEVVAARRHYVADFAVVCASGMFTDAAFELAASNKVLLCRGEQLARRLDAMG